MIIGMIIIFSMLMTHTAAVLAVGNNARAIEVARENSTSAIRLERAVAEAAQNVSGIGFQPSTRTFADELSSTMSSASMGAATISISSAPSYLERLKVFPDWSGSPTALAAPSAELLAMANPAIREFIGLRVAETAVAPVQFTLDRSLVSNTKTYGVQIDVKLVAVPLTRYTVVPYDLPFEIGSNSGSAAWPSTFPVTAVAPLGLVPVRDPANVSSLETGSNRPGYFRRLSVMSEAIQYVFSNTYVQKVSDYCGGNHFVQIGGGANPVLDGGTERGISYTLDVGQYGRGRLGPLDDIKDAGVFWTTSASAQLQISDSGGATGPMLLIVAGPSNVSVGHLTVQLVSSITRPIIIVGYNVEVVAAGPVNVNGALILDRDCFVGAAAGPITTGHVSYWSGGTVNPDAFRMGAMPVSAEALAPRVIYAVTNRSFF